jgi:competence protein ComEA
VTGTEAGTAGETDGGLVDINTAAKEELLTLPGVGESRAQSIISYREKNGGFSRIEDIMRVEGIKEGMFAKMKDKICVRGVR